ncbi:ABZJ_00895 family protein [Acinetobacter rudis]|uniref:ABZJ_00895 family protein n=1 Tax=Acinetobacter rudis TaxID=632955 RepID=UPI00280C505C|nr:ABZJ_00895 family protein [Acinetobacter rudis]MDQ8953758.1 ABZJ_00895 family protein [Acinetobacter rudis]
MFTLSRYYLWFLFFCFVYTIVTGLIAAWIPNEIAAALVTTPYLAAMITVLHIFLKRERRAPTSSEKKYFTVVFLICFWLFNILGLLASLAYFSAQDPNVWQSFLSYLNHGQFLLMALGMVVLVSIPMVLITLWFYGKQAQRMALRLFGSSKK